MIIFLGSLFVCEISVTFSIYGQQENGWIGFREDTSNQEKQGLDVYRSDNCDVIERETVRIVPTEAEWNGLRRGLLW